MFTPPPSPEPRRIQHTAPAVAADRSPTSLRKLDAFDDPFLSPHCTRTSSSSPERPSHTANDSPLSPKEDPDSYAYGSLHKKRIARRTKWAVFLVPLVLALIGLSTRYLTHPAAFDALRPRSSWRNVADSVTDWRPHKRHAAPDPAPADTAQATTIGSAKPTGSSLSLASSASEAAPTAVDTSKTTVPSAPPVLPTPFPQPFDQSLSTNFTTVACQAFFTNMTQTAPFRECRPFSLLVSDSSAFITSQRNVSLLNNIIWGTCNTDLNADECTSNMAWFADNIKTQCKQDIAANNPIVQDAVAGLEAYTIMRTVGCQINPQTNTYCYIDAAQSAHPSDLYLYELPLGLPLPNSTVPSCTACVQSAMKVFAEQGGGDVGDAVKQALTKTYPAAAAVVNGACGAEFVADLQGAASNGAHQRWTEGPWTASVLTVGAAMLLLLAL
ncbi:hypothetical protein BV20DRAFT_1035778 [Pilatotrama ljubarskyi]|nr:hypothetical protein BV20DRAFT_1035778 [Pilatotrama ljubarskyi]